MRGAREVVEDEYTKMELPVDQVWGVTLSSKLLKGFFSPALLTVQEFRLLLWETSSSHWGPWELFVSCSRRTWPRRPAFQGNCLIKTFLKYWETKPHRAIGGSSLQYKLCNSKCWNLRMCLMTQWSSSGLSSVFSFITSFKSNSLLCYFIGATTISLFRMCESGNNHRGGLDAFPGDG